MSTSKSVIEIDGEEWHRVRPIDHISSGGRERERPFTFSRAYPSDIPDAEVDAPKGAEYEMVEDGVARYQYGERAAIIITPDGPYCKPDATQREAEKQAFFAMSVLDEHGLVSGWRRK